MYIFYSPKKQQTQKQQRKKQGCANKQLISGNVELYQVIIEQ